MKNNDKKTLQVCTLGTATMDTIVRMAPDSLERMLLQNANKKWILLESGRKIESDFIQAFTGGSAINSAVNFIKQGIAVKIIAKVGTDMEATFLLESIVKEGLNTDSLIYSKKHSTARSVIVVAADNNPTVLVDRGANSYISKDNINESDIVSSDLFYVGSLSNMSALVAPWAAKLAYTNDVLVFFNPGKRQITRYAKELKEMLPSVNILSVNNVEAVNLATSFYEGGKIEEIPSGKLKPWLLEHSIDLFTHKISFWHIAKQLIKCGTHQVIITHGEHGVFTMRKDGEAWHCPSLKSDKIVSSIGAGDAFNSTFCSNILMNNDVETALQQATVQAVSVIKHLNAQGGLLLKKDLEEKWQSTKSSLKVLNQKMPL